MNNWISRPRDLFYIYQHLALISFFFIYTNFISELSHSVIIQNLKMTLKQKLILNHRQIVIFEPLKCKLININNIKNNGAKCKPCGTPDEILNSSKVKFLT